MDENNLLIGELRPQNTLEARRMPGKRKRKLEEGESTTTSSTPPKRKRTKKSSGLYGWITFSKRIEMTSK